MTRTVRRLGVVATAMTQTWLSASTAYLLALVGLAARGDARGRGAPAGEPLRTVVLVPAHDEAAGIAPTVAALRAQAYPAGRFEVIVVADNCRDATAAQARTVGATVWERDDPSARGKGHALAWALERLWRERAATEAVAIVDADCRASANLLAAFDAELRSGAAAVQSAYDVANPQASSASALRWAGFALMHRVRPRGRRRLGLSADLFGTGMAFRAELLRAHPWRSFGVTEDAEYHLELVRAGVPVAFAASASVESRMPTSAAGARDQQLRWETGNAGLARRTVGPLARAGVRRGDKHLLHAALEQLVPPQTVLLAANGATLLGALALRRPALIGAASSTIAGQALYVMGGLRVVGAPPTVYRALGDAPALVARKLPLFARIAAGRGATAWKRTVREA